MNNLQNLLNEISDTSDCDVLLPLGMPTVNAGHMLPADVRLFYELCGGVTLYSRSVYGVRLCSPKEFVLANPVIRGDGIAPNELLSFLPHTDISWSWYLVGEGVNGGDFITIDCSETRLGWCYQSFWDSHAVPGDTPIIAKSFMRLIDRLFRAKGDYWYWLQNDFKTLGDAYN